MSSKRTETMVLY